MDILYLEDDVLLAQSIIEELEYASYSVMWVRESDEAIEASYSNSFKLYLFDVNVPGINGFELLKSLRESGDLTPTLFITSRNQIKDMKEGFRVGADDYIKKPFDLDELFIRIEAKMPSDDALYLSPDFSIDIKNYTLSCKKKVITLSLKEFGVLRYFFERVDQLNETEAIIDYLYEEPISIATFRTYVKNIKRYIDGCGVIENVKGVGYRLRII
jgi:DNA-binding response OmpR family regulator